MLLKLDRSILEETIAGTHDIKVLKTLHRVLKEEEQELKERRERIYKEIDILEKELSELESVHMIYCVSPTDIIEKRIADLILKG